MRALCAVPALLSLITMFGCQPADPASAMLEDYAGRVANVLEADPAEPEKTGLLQTLPPRRDRHIETGDLRIGLLDFLELKECDMRQLVSQRNSVLGRVMPPSRQLVYEVRLVRALEACAQHLARFPSEQGDFADLITQALTQKRAELPSIVWNASFATEEIERALSLTHGHLQPGTDNILNESTREFRWFAESMRDVLGDGQAPGIEELETHYQAIAFNPAPGQLFRSMLLAIDWLAYVSGVLEQTDLRRLCPQEAPTRKARILQTVFSKFYAGKVQPWLSMLHREGADWQSAIHELINVQQVESPAAFQNYARVMLESDRPESLWALFHTAIQTHTKSWQRVLGHCGMMPSVETLQESAARSLP